MSRGVLALVFVVGLSGSVLAQQQAPVTYDFQGVDARRVVIIMNSLNSYPCTMSASANAPVVCRELAELLTSLNGQIAQQNQKRSQPPAPPAAPPKDPEPPKE